MNKQIYIQSLSFVLDQKENQQTYDTASQAECHHVVACLTAEQGNGLHYDANKGLSEREAAACHFLRHRIAELHTRLYRDRQKTVR